MELLTGCPSLALDIPLRVCLGEWPQRAPTFPPKLAEIESPKNSALAAPRGVGSPAAKLLFACLAAFLRWLRAWGSVCLSMCFLIPPLFLLCLLLPQETKLSAQFGRGVLVFLFYVLKKTLTVICIFNIVADIMCMKVTCMQQVFNKCITDQIFKDSQHRRSSFFSL